MPTSGPLDTTHVQDPVAPDHPLLSPNRPPLLSSALPPVDAIPHAILAQRDQLPPSSSEHSLAYARKTFGSIVCRVPVGYFNNLEECLITLRSRGLLDIFELRVLQNSLHTVPLHTTRSYLDDYLSGYSLRKRSAIIISSAYRFYAYWNEHEATMNACWYGNNPLGAAYRFLVRDTGLPVLCILRLLESIDISTIAFSAS